MNKMIATGFIVRKPELIRLTPELILAKVPFGITRTKGENKTSYVTLEFWGEGKSKLAMDYLKTGDKVLVEGHLKISSFRNPKNKLWWKTYVGVAVERFELQKAFTSSAKDTEQSIFEDEETDDIQEIEYIESIISNYDQKE